MTELKIEYKKINELEPYKNNPRLNDGAVDKVADSISEFGFKNPIIVDAENVIIAGHTRLKAAKQLGLDTVPTIKVEDLTGEQVKAFRIADNKTAEFAEWDMELLELEFEEIEDLFTGFDDLELNDLFFEEGEAEEDDYEVELPEEPKSKLGDIYQLGRHRLMCGDSTNKKTVEKLMDGKKADMVFTDPPYGVNYKSNMSNKFEELKNDDTFLDILPVLKKFSNKNTHWYIWTSHQVYPVWRNMFSEFYKNTIIWSKGGGGMGDLEGNYATDYEMCLFCHFGRKSLLGKREGAVWDVKKDNGASYIHPTQKPVALSDKAIHQSSVKDDIILDLFGGSGSTLIAAEQLGRTCYMMELDPKYVDVIIDRWESYTGQKAVLLNA